MSSGAYPERTLVKFSGSGEYVTIEASIKSIDFVKKNTANMPDMKGVLSEKGSVSKIPFVVREGVKHPYFDTGKTYRFEWVKDYRYEKTNEVQALITNKTSFTEL